MYGINLDLTESSQWEYESPSKANITESSQEHKNQCLQTMDLLITVKWYIKINLLINNKFYIQDLIALVDSEDDLNCLKEEIIPIKYCEPTAQTLRDNNKALITLYKVTDVNFL